MNTVFSLHQFFSMVTQIFIFLSITTAAWYSTVIIPKTIAQFGIKNKINEKQIHLITKIIKFVFYFIATIFILSMFENQLAHVAQTMSFVALGIGLALQKELSNLTSGIFIIFNKSFKINDYIIHKDFEGKIITIDLHVTTLKNEENIILVPNYILHTSVITIKK